MTDPSPRRHDWTTDLGIGVVGLAAAILTFSTLRALGESVGFRENLFDLIHQAWLLPICIDAAGIVAARVWLRGIGGPAAIRYARVLTLVCIAESIVGNGGQHLMVELKQAPPWFVVVLVTAIPPAMLGAVVHLGYLLRRPAVEGADLDQAQPGPDHPTRTPGPGGLMVHTNPQTGAVAVERTAGPVSLDHPDRPAPDRPRTAGLDRRSLDPDHHAETTWTAPVRALRVAPETARPDRPDRPTRTAPDLASDQAGPGGLDLDETGGPDQLLEAVREWADHQDGAVSQRAIRAAFGVGGPRAQKIHQQLTETARTGGPDQADRDPVRHLNGSAAGA
jgi:uncharacterized protein DUF2637